MKTSTILIAIGIFLTTFLGTSITLRTLLMGSYFIGNRDDATPINLNIGLLDMSLFALGFVLLYIGNVF